jgi:hypothetical protein
VKCFAGWLTKGACFRCHVSGRKELAGNCAESILALGDNPTDLPRRQLPQALQRPALSGEARRWPSTLSIRRRINLVYEVCTLAAQFILPSEVSTREARSQTM